MLAMSSIRLHQRRSKYKEWIVGNENVKQELINLSKEKWDWMSERNVENLDALFHEKSVFVHMGGSWGKA